MPPKRRAAIDADIHHTKRARTSDLGEETAISRSDRNRTRDEVRAADKDATQLHSLSLASAANVGPNPRDTIRTTIRGATRAAAKDTARIDELSLTNATSGEVSRISGVADFINDEVAASPVEYEEHDAVDGDSAAPTQRSSTPWRGMGTTPAQPRPEYSPVRDVSTPTEQKLAELSAKVHRIDAIKHKAISRWRKRVILRRTARAATDNQFGSSRNYRASALQLLSDNQRLNNEVERLRRQVSRSQR